MLLDLALAFAIVLSTGAAAFRWGGVGLEDSSLLGAGIAALALVQSVRAARRPQPLDRALVLVAALAAAPLVVGALQLVPLSRGTIRALAPATADLYDKDDKAAASPKPSPRPLSLEPASTRRAVLRGATLVALFLLSASLARRERAARALALSLGALAWVVGFAGLAGAAQDAISAGPTPWGKRAHSPFWNPNNFAAFVEVLLPLGTGVFLARPRTREGKLTLEKLLERPELGARGLGLATAAISGAAIVQSQSRAAALAAALGGAAAVLLARSVTRRSVAPLVVLGIGLALGIAWPSAGTGERVARGIGAEDLAGRLVWWRAGARVLEGRTLVGSGLGTFDAVSFAHLEPSSEVRARPALLVRAERAHNDYLNLATDLGVPAAVLGVSAAACAVGFVLASLRRTHGERRALAAGAIGGALAALLHALVDFGLEIPAIGALFATVLGIAWGASRGDIAWFAEREARSENHPRKTSSTVHSSPETRSHGKKERLVFLHVASALVLASIFFMEAREALAARRIDEAAASEAALKRDGPALETAAATLARCRAARALAPDDFQTEERRARVLASVADIFSSSEALSWRLDAVLAAREAARLAPARARVQGLLAEKLLDAAHALDVAPVASGARAEHRLRAALLRTEGESRLSLALSLGPTYPNLLFSAGTYYLLKTAETGSRADFERARDYLVLAADLQPDTPPNYRESARRLVAYLSKERGQLGAYADELDRALSGHAKKP